MLRLPLLGAFLLAILTASAPLRAQGAQPSRPDLLSEQRPWEIHLDGSYEAGRRALDSLYVALAAARGGPFVYLEPGEVPEGDNGHDLTYTPSGHLLISANSFTNNITVIDAETHATLANVEVGALPIAVAATDEVAVVACIDSDEVYVVDLTTYAVRAVNDDVQEPVRVEVMPDGARAVVAGHLNQEAVILDLATGETLVHIPDFPTALHTFGGSLPAVRLYWYFRPFVITPDGETIVAGRSIPYSRLLFYDGATGALVDSLDTTAFPVGMALAGDGEHLVVGITSGPPQALNRIHVPTRTLVGSLSTSAQGSNRNAIAPSFDGRRAVIPHYSGGFITVGVADFDTGTVTVLPGTYGTSAESLVGGRYAIAYSSVGMSVVDMETGQAVASERRGHGAVAPHPGGGGRFATVSPRDREAFRSYAYAGGTLTPLGAAPLGAVEEGDGPIYVAALPDGERGLVLNTLSRNMSLVDLGTGAVSHTPPTLPIRSLSVNPLAENERALVLATPPHHDYQIWLYLTDLGTGALLDSLEMGTEAFVAGSGPYVLAASPSLNLVVLHVAGDEFTVAAAYPDARATTMAASSDGRYLVALDPFTRNARFFGGETGDLLTTVPDIGIDGAAFSPGGAYAAVTSNFHDTFSVFALDGADVTLQGTYDCDCSSPGLVALTDDVVAVESDGEVLRFDRSTGDLIGRHDISSGEVLFLTLEPDGQIVALEEEANGQDYLYYRSTWTEIPDVPSGPFNDPVFRPLYSPEHALILYPRPGPDAILLLDLTAVGVEADPPGSAPLALTAHPNPSRGAVTLAYRSSGSPLPVTVEVYDALGRLVHRRATPPQELGPHPLTWAPAEAAPSGVYLVRLQVGDQTAQTRVTVLR